MDRPGEIPARQASTDSSTPEELAARLSSPHSWMLSVSLILLGVFSLVAWFLQHQFPNIEAEESLGSNLGFFLLINLNIVVVLILAFLVVKNIIKLALDRRRKILGAKLRTRLVVAFVGLSLIPTILLFTVAKGIVERVLQGWFSPQVEASVDGAVEIASLYYEESERQLRKFGVHLGKRLAAVAPTLISGSQSMEGYQALGVFLEEKRREYDLFELALYSPSGERLLQVRSNASSVSVPPVNAAVLFKAQSSVHVQAEQSLTAEFLRAYVPIYLPSISELLVPDTKADPRPDPEANPTSATFVVVATRWVLPEISSSLSSVISAHDDYRELRTYRRPLASSYFLTLVIVTLLIIFAAVWVGFYLARGISIPIGLLAEGTQQVAHGNLAYRIPDVGDDELSVLVRSFNTMTEDLQRTTGELVERRRYMETLLAQVDVGVVSLDLAKQVTTCNGTALAIMGAADSAQGALCLESGAELRGIIYPQCTTELASLAPRPLAEAVLSIIEQLRASGVNTASTNLELEDAEGARHVHLSVTTLIGDEGQALGYVLLLDNISDLVSAQRMAAWREVARRIAHEIKNPLTPIQLSAQRIQRRIAMPDGSSARAVEEYQLIRDATATIVKQVEILRTLVNEFSRFARMPKTSPTTGDICKVAHEVVRFFKEAHPHIEFSCSFPEQMPQFPFDAEQINRVLTNLIDNGIAATEIRSAESDASYQPHITVRVAYDPGIQMVSISVADNGCGIAAENKARLFEPYFSTKSSGTGLGLAIVSTIIADHHGYIRVSDVKPRGSKFTFELPLHSSGAELRRKQV